MNFQNYVLLLFLRSHHLAVLHRPSSIISHVSSLNAGNQKDIIHKCNKVGVVSGGRHEFQVLVFLQELVAVIDSREKVSGNMGMSEQIAAVDLGCFHQLYVI